ncbi:MAG TPA: cupin domain-containing protein [Candidatus Sulfotelmatobacter sp.]
MRRRLTRSALFSTVLVVTALWDARNLHATSPQGFTSTTVARARLGATEAHSYLIPPRGKEGNDWLSFQRTQGSSDLYVQDNVWQPGGSTGWHSHPGHSLIIVTAGTVTDYAGHDLDCKPHVYTKGMGFVDPGGDHVHVIRNEGAVQARAIAVQIIPTGKQRRIDAPGPGNCRFWRRR